MNISITPELEQFVHAQVQTGMYNSASEVIREAFALLAERPFIGQRREDMTSLDVRFWPNYSYQIVYHAEADPLQIIRILSGYRDIDGILQN